MSHPTNEGRICVRGWHVHEVASSPDRLRKPLLKKNGQFQEVSWDQALEFIATRVKEIRARHGPDALAFLSSPRCSNEEAYLLQKLARTVIGTNNVDHGTGVYCNNSINVLLDMLGVPATTSSVSDLARSDVIIVDGVDLARQLPTIGGAVIRAKLRGSKVIVIDSRRHRVAESADFFLQLRPGTEVLLYGAMAKVIVDRGLANLPFIRAHCRDYKDFLAHVRDYDLLAASESCGVAAEQIEAAALAYGGGRSTAILYSAGIEARDATGVEAIVNLALLTGQLGTCGGGIFALTEHNNLQGVCDMGVLPDRLPGYRKIAEDAERGELEQVWQTKLPAKPGLTSRSLLVDRGGRRVRALWLCRYDPVSTAFFGDAANVLQECELVVAQHLFLTDSARHAHVVLPTTAFGEERVTFTSTERRIQLAEQVIEPLSGTTPGWQQLTQVARALGADWNYDSSADVMDEIGRAVPCYSGASYPNLADGYGRQWPCTKDRPLGTRSLFEEEFPAGGFKFVPIPKSARGAVVSREYPLTLVFGHSLYYWHRNVLIQHSETLRREYRILLLDYPEGFVEMNPEDARRLDIRDGQRICLRAAGGAAVTFARVTPEVRSGAVIAPYFVRQVQQQIRGSTEDSAQLIPVRVEKAIA
jgi:predicted molibdopterin-dependent oxidoreductase YjgC